MLIEKNPLSKRKMTFFTRDCCFCGAAPSPHDALVIALVCKRGACVAYWQSDLAFWVTIFRKIVFCIAKIQVAASQYFFLI